MQKTIKKAVEFSGVGLHSGKETLVTLKSAPVDTGIVFIRTDIAEKPKIKGEIKNLTQKQRRTALISGDAEVYTVEHLLAVCSVFGITNLFIEMNGEEVPGLDGSALPFFKGIQEAGIELQEKESEEIIIQKDLKLEEGKASLEIFSHEGFCIEYHMDHDVSFFPAQSLTLEIDEKVFGAEVAPARTFVLKREVEYLQKIGLGKGANVKNTLVIDEDGQIIDNTLRFPDECIRHKILDLIGDLALLGKNLKAKIVAHRSGHDLNVRLVEKIVDVYK